MSTAKALCLFAVCLLFAVSRSNAECVPWACAIPPNPGLCKARQLRWFYNVEARTCQRFYYGGCNGNANNFLTEAVCLRTCRKLR